MHLLYHIYVYLWRLIDVTYRPMNHLSNISLLRYCLQKKKIYSTPYLDLNILNCYQSFLFEKSRFPYRNYARNHAIIHEEVSKYKRLIPCSMLALCLITHHECGPLRRRSLSTTLKRPQVVICYS